MNLEHERAQMMKDFHKQKEIVLMEHDKELLNLKENQQAEIYDMETRMQERTDRDAKVSIREE